MLQMELVRYVLITNFKMQFNSRVSCNLIMPFYILSLFLDIIFDVKLI